MSVNVGKAVGYLDLDTSNFKKGFSSALSDLKVFNDSTATSTDKLAAVGSAATSTGRSLTKYLTVPLAGFGALSVKTSAEFDAGMSKVQAISGATSSQLEQLRDKAINMGAKTKFSATESAEAFQYMAMAGWDTAAMLDGIEGIMNLAAASGEDLALTSDIVTDALTGFGLQASDSAHFADVLAMASSRSNTNVALMGETFKYVAPVAGSLGYNVEDTAVAIGLMANAGIKGSQAGTTLRSIFTRLVKPVGEAKTAVNELGISLTNSDGTMKPLSQTLVELRQKFDGMTASEKAQYAAMLAGQEGMSGFLALINASDADFENLTREINNADGAAQEMAGVMMDNLPGALEQASGAVETLMIRIGDVLTPIVVKVVNVFTSFVEKLSSASDGTLRFAVGLGVVLASIGPLLLILGHTATNILALISLYQKLTQKQDQNTGSMLKNTAASISNTASRVASNAALNVGKIVGYTTNLAKNTAALVRNTATTVANTTSQLLSSVATSKAGTAFLTGASKVLAFAAANKVAILTTAGLLAPLILIAGYMLKTGDSAEEVAQKITAFSTKLAGMITFFAEQFPSMVNSFVTAFTNVIDAVVAQIPALIPLIVQAGIQLFMGLVQSISSIIEPLTAAIPQVINAIIAIIPTLIPLVVQAGIMLLMGLVQSVQQIIGPLVEALPILIEALVQALITLVPAVLQAGITLLMALIQAIPKIIPPLVAAIPKIVNAIVSQIPVLIPVLLNGAVQLFMAFVQAIPKIVPVLIRNSPKIVKAVIQGVLTLSKSLFNTGIQLLKMLWNGISSWVGTLRSKVVRAVKSLPSKIRSGLGSLVSIGKNWLAGLWTGISSGISGLLGKIESLGSTIKSKIKSIFKISSPSKWMRDMIGKNMMIGWANGLVGNLKLVLGSIVDSSRAVQRAYKDNAFDVSPEDLPFDPEDFDPTKGNPSPTNSPYGSSVDNSYKGGDTYNFYSPVALTPMESAKQMKKAKRDLILGY